MKYKKRLANLKRRQEYWDRQTPAYQAANKRPGSKNK